MDEYTGELEELVATGDLGYDTYDRATIIEKLGASQRLYIEGGFNFYEAVRSAEPLIVYRVAYSSLVKSPDGKSVPKTVAHLYEEFGTEDVRSFIAEREAPRGQCVWSLDCYADAFSLDLTNGYCYRRECWVQAGNRESPAHVDHGRVLSYIPPALQRSFKIWIAFKDFNAARGFSFAEDDRAFNRMLVNGSTGVVVQRPGDVVYVNSLIYHSVLLCYTSETPEIDRWSIIDGYVFILREDILVSYIYATQAKAGTRKGDNRVWARILMAYCAMEGRWLDTEQIDVEISRFTSAVMTKHPSLGSKSLAGACSRKRKEKKAASIAFARSCKNKK